MEPLNELTAALTKAQAAMKPALKDSTNPHFRNRYADLESVWDAVREPLTKNGLAVSQVLSEREGRTYLKTLLLHTSGQSLASEMPLNPTKSDPQALGSAISYARRYSLAALVGVVQSDDDGQEASHADDDKQEAPKAPKKESAPKAPQKAAVPFKEKAEPYTFPSGNYQGRTIQGLSNTELSTYLDELLKRIEAKPGVEPKPEVKRAVDLMKAEQAKRQAAQLQTWEES